MARSLIEFGAGARNGGPPGFLVILLIAVAMLVGCTGKLEQALAATTTERDEARAAGTVMAKSKDEALSALSAANITIASLQAENAKLKQTPRFYFDQAIEEMKGAQVANTDEGDRAVILRFQEVARRFPGDPLALESGKMIAEEEARIATRGVALKRAQSEVRRLIQTCRREARAAKQATDGSLVFNYRNDIDMNAALAGERAAEPHRKAMGKAKESAEAMLKTVPDPDGSLATQVEQCDTTE